MRESFFPDRQPRKLKDEKKPILDVSVSAKRRRIAELKQQIQKIEDVTWKTQDFFAMSGLRRRERILLESRRNKRGAMIAEMDKLEYELMSHEERSALMDEIKRLQMELSQFDSKNQLKIERVKLISTLNRLWNSVPLQEQERLTKAAANEKEKDYWQRLEATARECVHHGIDRLNKTLMEILEKEKQLPSVILYPETSARPLAYTVAPLLRHVYDQAHQPMPHIFFIKIFSKLVTEIGHKKTIQSWLEEIRELVKQKVKLHTERDHLLRELKKERKTETKERLSQKIHEVSQKIQKFNGQIEEKKITTQAMNEKRFKEIVKERLNDILLASPKGSILVIDDVLASSRTFSSLYEQLLQLGHENDSHFFAFCGFSEALETDGIPLDHQSLGVGYDADVNERDVSLEERIGYSFTPSFEGEGQKNLTDKTADWYELINVGFPYRSKKEKRTGVIKDQWSLAKIVQRSLDRDAKAMKEIRETYRQWGEEARDVLFKTSAVDLLEGKL